MLQHLHDYTGVTQKVPQLPHEHIWVTHKVPQCPPNHVGVTHEVPQHPHGSAGVTHDTSPRPHNQAQGDAGTALSTLPPNHSRGTQGTPKGCPGPRREVPHRRAGVTQEVPRHPRGDAGGAPRIPGAPVGAFRSASPPPARCPHHKGGFLVYSVSGEAAGGRRLGKGRI